MSHLQHLCSLTLSFCEVHGSSLHVSHRLVTRHGEQCRRACAGNLAAEQKSDERSEVDCAQCKFQRREESTPGNRVS